MRTIGIWVVAAAALAACGQPQPAPETAMAPAGAGETAVAATALLGSTGSVTLAAQDSATGPALTFTRTVHGDGAEEGQDPHIIVRLQAGPGQFVELHEANHTPFDVTAQAAGGVLATAIGAGDATPVFYRVEQAEGAPFLCAPSGPVSAALYEDGAGGLVIVGLTVASFEGTEGETGITLSPLPEGAVCGRAVYGPAAP